MSIHIELALPNLVKNVDQNDMREGFFFADKTNPNMTEKEFIAKLFADGVRNHRYYFSNPEYPDPTKARDLINEFMSDKDNFDIVVEKVFEDNILHHPDKAEAPNERDSRNSKFIPNTLAKVIPTEATRNRFKPFYISYRRINLKTLSNTTWWPLRLILDASLAENESSPETIAKIKEYCRNKLNLNTEKLLVKLQKVHVNATYLGGNLQCFLSIIPMNSLLYLGDNVLPNNYSADRVGTDGEIFSRSKYEMVIPVDFMEFKAPVNETMGNGERTRTFVMPSFLTPGQVGGYTPGGSIGD